jgi:L-ascorbate metabolism protein UlaG (beta-lactamase superfamily)
MKLTYYGHSCFSVQAGGKTLLFDPFVTPNELAKSVDVDKIPADYILCSHGHYDHMFDAVRIAQRTNAKVLAGYELYDWFTKNGVSNAHPINPGGKFAFDFGTVKSFTAVHSNSLPDGRYSGVASGFAVKTNDGNFYYSGDTALTLDMQLVANWTKLNFAVLPIGDDLTMGVEDAIQSAKFVGATKVLGVHYDTFPVIKIDHVAAQSAFTAAGLQLHLAQINSTFDL